MDSKLFISCATAIIAASSAGDANAQSPAGASQEAARYQTCPVFGQLGPDTTAVAPPVSRPPTLKDMGQARKAVERENEKLQKAGSTGGRAIVWFMVDASGSLKNVWIAESSGSALVDSAALHAARSFHFSAAELNGTPVCFWFAQPIMLGHAAGPPRGGK